MLNPETRILVARHERKDNGGAIVRTLESHGAFVDLRTLPPVGRDYPEISEYDAVVVMGGMTSANAPIMKENIVWMEELIASDKPGLAVCLGYQIMARALGATVSEAKTTEVGFFSNREGLELLLTEEGSPDPVLSAVATEGSVRQVFGFHSDSVKVPDTNVTEKLIVVARGIDNEVQAIRARFGNSDRPSQGGRLLGTQIHPDMARKKDLVAFKDVFRGILDGSIKTKKELEKEFREERRKRALRGLRPATGIQIVNSFVRNELEPQFAFK